MIMSILYGIIIEIRNKLYDYDLLTSQSFDKPIISIGNITTGGTGKTPLAIHIAKYILNQGKKPGIISRGYRRVSSGMVIVHDGKEMLVDVNNAGDEPYLIGKKLKNVPIIVSNKRYEGIKTLFENFFVDIVIMDDGFQHRSIKRELNILTISGTEKIQNYKLLPFGKMREPICNIKRADLIIYTKSNEKPIIHNKIHSSYLKNFILSNYKPKLFYYNLKTFNEIKILDELVFAFCGIADHKSFFKSITDMGIKIKEKKYYKDHQDYSDILMKDLMNKIKKLKLNKVIITEKDLVKIPQFFIDAFDIYVIKISMNIKDELIMQNKIDALLN